jgi:2-methylisocitrate lyase-like PEP mutase family enzyme
MTTTSFKLFRDLHFTPSPFLLLNAWDAASAALWQEEGAVAIATSSAALAWSLGYPDGGSLPRHELLAAIKRIVRVLHVPLSVDIEDGYSESPDAVAQLVMEIAQCGVAGINIEDGANSPENLCKKLHAIRYLLADTELFVNVRTDVFLRQLAPQDTALSVTIARLLQYREAGADAAFVPGLMRLEQVSMLAPSIGMPLNLMMLPDMPTIADLTAAGAQRFSVGPALFQSGYGYTRRLAQQFLGRQDVSNLFDHSISYEPMNAVFQVQ